MNTLSNRSNIASLFRAVYVILAVLLLALSYLYNVYFLAGGLICAVLFGFIQYRFIFISRKEETYQKQKCKYAGFMLLIPSLGMIANGIGLLILPDAEMPVNLRYAVIAVLAVMAIGLSAHIFVFRNDSSLSAKFLRYSDCAALSTPIVLISQMAIKLSGGEDTAAIGCMSAALLGVLSLLIAANMILTSFCGYKTTRESYKTVSAMLKGKKHILFRAVAIKDGFLVAGKLIISLASLSFFMLVNGLYSVGMGVGRYIAVRMCNRSKKEQIKDYRRIGGIILFSGVCYVLYSARLFFGGKSVAYPMIVAIAIACYTFIEFGINIREIIRLLKSEELEAKALRALSFSSTLLCFVLTQTALMSFAHPGNPNFFNALSGVVFGGLAALVGIYVLISAGRINLHALERVHTNAQRPYFG